MSDTGNHTVRAPAGSGGVSWTVANTSVSDQASTRAGLSGLSLRWCRLSVHLRYIGLFG